MSRDLFGTDGVRGLAGEYPLDGDGAVKIGRAVGTLFAEAGQQIVIAGDPRESSEGLVEALTRGMTQVGVNVVNIGVLPTPGLAYITRETNDFVAGIMVTASHNPFQYNGVKVFDGFGGKLNDEIEAKLNSLVVGGVPDRGEGTSTNNPEHVKDYQDFLTNSANGQKLTSIMLAVDSANGAASDLAAQVFEALGAEVMSLSDSPNGRNINDHCGATDTTALRKTVVDSGLHLGIALDGDGDRLIMVDGQGRDVNGDYLLYILAVANRYNGVVATVMSNLGFEQALDDKNIKLERVQVGDRYVLDGLAKTGYELGGEQSGHIILSSLLATGDGLLAAVQVLAALSQSSKSLAEWRDEVKMLPQALVNIKLTDKSGLEKTEVKSYVAEQAKAIEGNGRLLIRPSGTEPLARVMVESEDAETLAHKIANELRALLK